MDSEAVSDWVVVEYVSGSRKVFVLESETGERRDPTGHGAVATYESQEAAFDAGLYYGLMPQLAAKREQEFLDSLSADDRAILFRESMVGMSMAEARKRLALERAYQKRCFYGSKGFGSVDVFGGHRLHIVGTAARAKSGHK